jgi:3-hydroxypropanoate dehydrogenase
VAKINSEALDVLFNKARTHNGWLDKPVSSQTLHELYDLLKMAPTSANTLTWPGKTGPG